MILLIMICILISIKKFTYISTILALLYRILIAINGMDEVATILRDY